MTDGHDRSQEKPDSEETICDGFQKPETNFFKMPNEWTNWTARMTSIAEMKVVEYVIRHTWGYQEYDIVKIITTDEFMNGRKRKDGTRMDKGTGLSNRATIDGLSRAINHGFLICEVDSRDRARIKKGYALNMRSSSSSQERKHNNRYEQSSHPQGSNPDSGCEQSSQLDEQSSHHHEQGSQRSEKETRRKKLEEREEAPPTDVVPPKESSLSLSDQEQKNGPSVSQENQWSVEICLALFENWRGAPLIDTSQQQRARSLAASLVKAYSREQVTAVYEQMNGDPYWQARGGADIEQVARHISSELKKRENGSPTKKNHSVQKDHLKVVRAMSDEEWIAYLNAEETPPKPAVRELTPLEKQNRERERRHKESVASSQQTPETSAAIQARMQAVTQSLQEKQQQQARPHS